MLADERVVRHISGIPSTREQSWSRLVRYVGHWSLMGFGYWVVEDHQGAFLGEVGFADYQRAITPPLTAPEAGWVFASPAHGAGYATEAVRRMTAWADECLAASETVCIFDPSHEASIHVALKCGYGDPVHVDYAGVDTLMLKRARKTVTHPGAGKPVG
jgi:RimJ/RimL family protein N-acetyltransferase